LQRFVALVPRRRFPPPADVLQMSVETLRAVDVDRLTPLEALQLVAKLKGLVNASAPPAPPKPSDEPS